MANQSEVVVKKTRFALLFASLIHEPFASLIVWMPFILRKDLGATAFQLALLVTLKPTVSLLSFYWSSLFPQDKLRSNLIVTGILARLPFALFFFIDDIWFLIFASALHMLFSRAGTPAWMEILKLNLPEQKRGKLFSLSSALGYAEGVLIALSLGFLLDADGHAWKLLFLCSALLGMLGVYIQGRLPIQEIKREKPTPSSNHFTKPWKEMWQLLKARPDFAQFQWGFMTSGIGIMLVIATLPLFFVDVLQLSHVKFGTARSVYMGLGFVLSSPIWGALLKKMPLAHVTCLVCAFFGAFSGLLFLSQESYFWLYFAYLVYGIAQGGSHLVWHLSGPIFAKEEDSSLFTNVNIIMVGIRGLFAPFLGSFLYAFTGPTFVLSLGTLLCFAGGAYMLYSRRRSLLVSK